jgi:hypothetical protein
MSSPHQPIFTESRRIDALNSACLFQEKSGLILPQNPALARTAGATPGRDP